ncbi:MFS transporter [Granulicella sp. 5B5]|uniref:MFS transporter n=1 Tax=Granulicella sp. 5B5 TaxID=1617967 RepID=UPI0015F38D6D|nr:MFS transporter [Granulicella sp. 5B5]QMV19062.1 MFS transporter [Granulicella sp. 5B5]
MPTEASSNQTQTETSQLLRRVGWRILPLLLLLYFVAYLDRINIGFAAASMQRDLHFSDSLYGTGAGLFFLGALLAQLPSNLILYRFGARRTIAALMLIWGCISGAMAFIHSPIAFLILRFLLGAAEAGFYPGVILYLTLWLPRRVRTSFIAWFLFAIPMASIFGGPLSSWVLTHRHLGRFADWQLLLLTEAIPALLFGALLPFFMTDTPQQATWLTDHERTQLEEARTADEPPTQDQPTKTHALDVGPIRHLLLFALIYFAMQFGLYAQSFWLPKILGGMGVATAAIGWHVSLVYLGSAVIMLGWGYVVDRAPTRRWTLTVPLLLAAFGYAATSITAHIPHGTLALIIAMTAFGLGSAGALAATPPFWAQVTLGQRVTAIAGMIALINALGNLGGFAGPSALGWLHQHTGGYSTGMLSAGAAIFLVTALFYLSPSTRPE